MNREEIRKRAKEELKKEFLGYKNNRYGQRSYGKKRIVDDKNTRRV